MSMPVKNFFSRGFNPFNLRTTTCLAVLCWGALSTLSSCRLGNQIQSQQSSDGLTGYYESAPQSLKFCANHSVTLCKDATTNLAPAEVSQVMTNPVGLALQDAASGQAIFVGVVGGSPVGARLPTTVNPDLSISFIGSTQPQLLFQDPACTTKLTVNEVGKVDKSGPLLLNITTVRYGRINLDFTLTQSFDGNCASTLQQMHTCYLDASKCPGASAADNQNYQTLAISVFDDYIKSGAMTADDIPSTTQLGYEIIYQ